MKSQIRTYVDSTTEDQLKILSEQTGQSISSVVADLISKALNQNETGAESTPNGLTAEIITQQLYISHLTLLVALESVQLPMEQFQALKAQAKNWAETQTLGVQHGG